MERIQTSLTGINSTRLQLGFEGEQNHTRVVIYCTQIFSEYPDAVASMVIKPPTGDIYPKVLTRDGMKVIWDASVKTFLLPSFSAFLIPLQAKLVPLSFLVFLTELFLLYLYIAWQKL